MKHLRDIILGRNYLTLATISTAVALLLFAFDLAPWYTPVTALFAAAVGGGLRQLMKSPYKGSDLGLDAITHDLPDCILPTEEQTPPRERHRS